MAKKNEDREIISVASQADFQRWSFPSFDEQALNVIAKQQEPEENGQSELSAEEELAAVEVEEVEVEEIQPLTIEEVEAVRQDAYNEGFAAGEKDGFHAGQIKAAQQAQQELQPRLQALENIMHQLFEPINQQDRELEHCMLELVQQIATEVIRRELQLDSGMIAQVVRESIRQLPLEGEQVRIYLNPQDIESVKQLREQHEGSWRIIEDADLQPGGCRVESGPTMVDASMESRIAQIFRQLEEQQRSLQAQPPEPDLIAEYDLAPAAAAPEQPPEADRVSASEPEPEPPESAK